MGLAAFAFPNGNSATAAGGRFLPAWREFAAPTNVDDLALAILQAQRFYDNLEAVHSRTSGAEPLQCDF
jgi:hypothetical protein